MTTPYHARYFAHDLTRQHSSGGVDRLSMALFDACVDLNPHQIEAALFALRSPLLKGVILADEVGLGKTIEAGLVLCQHWAEKKRRLLVICPASIRKQWSLELTEKFNLPNLILDARTYRQAQAGGNPNPFQSDRVVITSLNFASRLRADIRAVAFDLVVIDEAHKLRNAYRPSNKMGQNIKWAVEERRKLLLTATPLQNSLLELYGLSTVIDDMIFGDPASFRSQYATNGADLTALRDRLHPFCKRTLRRQVVEYIQYTERRSLTIRFRPTDDEQKLYEAVSEYLMRENSIALPKRQRHLMALIMRKLLASSSHAVANTLETMRTRLEVLRQGQPVAEELAEELIEDEEIEGDLLDEILGDTADEEPPPTEQGKERRFVLCADEPLKEEDGELYIRFEYRPTEGKKQDELNQQAIQNILKAKGFDAWAHELGRLAPSDKNKDRTILEKHLSQYTARNTFDYFIHKDLGGFLGRELDFYIKNEVMHLDDIEHESAPKVEQYLSQIKVIRSIAHKIIAFLEQLENFQKKLWLKKKFVVETNYCITLDRVPDELYAQIAKNEAQREEWVRLFAIDEIKKDLNQPGYSKPLKSAFLKANPHLPLDTHHFSREFCQSLVSSLKEADAVAARCLVKADNFHALSILAPRHPESVRFIYIDPPYNTGSDEFLYKDNYQHSSWCAMLESRLHLAHEMLAEDGCIAVSIGQEELGTLQYMMDLVFGIQNRICVITVQRASVTGHKVINPGVVNISEYVLLYAKSRSLWTGNTVFAERERDERYNAFVRNRNADPSRWELISVLDAWSDTVGVQKSALRKHFGDQYATQLTQFAYENAESVCQPVTVDLDGVGADFRAAVERSRESGDKVQVFKRNGFPDVYLRAGKNLIFYRDKLITIGKRLATAERASDIWTDVLPNDLHNEGGVTLPKGKKPEALLARLIELGTEEGDTVLDFFAGTGTTSAVAQKMNRRWTCIECAAFFNEKPLRRMKNVLNGESRGVSSQFGWKGGGVFKVVDLESYDDALNNLELKRTKEQSTLLDADADAREQYILSYMLDVESRSSQSLLNINNFRNPDQYKLRVERNGETQLVNVDLVETFNWLLGLTVKHIDVIRGVSVVEGKNPEGDRVLVLWRNTEEMNNDKLDDWFKKQGYSTRDLEYDLVYVNGDNNLENLRRPDQTWKVRMIEEEFKRLMFDVADV